MHAHSLKKKREVTPEHCLVVLKLISGWSTRSSKRVRSKIYITFNCVRQFESQRHSSFRWPERKPVIRLNSCIQAPHCNLVVTCYPATHYRSITENLLTTSVCIFMQILNLWNYNRFLYASFPAWSTKQTNKKIINK